MNDMTDTKPIELTERIHDYIYLHELENILPKMVIKDLDPEYSKVVDDHFWELV